MNVDSLIAIKRNPRIPELASGDTVRVYIKVVEGGKERLQPFQGVVIKLQGGGVSATFTVRRIAYGVGVERTFPLYSPRVERVEVIRHGKVRRAKLYYLRGRSGKAARIKERRVDREKELARMEQLAAEAEEEETPEAPELAEEGMLAEQEEALPFETVFAEHTLERAVRHNLYILRILRSRGHIIPSGSTSKVHWVFSGNLAPSATWRTA